MRPLDHPGTPYEYRKLLWRGLHALDDGEIVGHGSTTFSRAGDIITVHNPYIPDLVFTLRPGVKVDFKRLREAWSDHSRRTIEWLGSNQ